MYNAEQFQDKKELTTYANDKYGVKLDGRLSMNDLVDGLNAAAFPNGPNEQSGEQEGDQKGEGQSLDAGAEQQQANQAPEAEKVPKPKVVVVYRNDVVGNALRLLRKRR